MSYNLNGTITLDQSPAVHYRFDNLTDSVGTKISSVNDLVGTKHLYQADTTKQPTVINTCNPDISDNRITAAYFTGGQYLKGEIPPAEQYPWEGEYYMVVVHENHHETETHKDEVKGSCFCISASAASVNHGQLGVWSKPAARWNRQTELRDGKRNVTITLAESYRFTDACPDVVWYKCASGDALGNQQEQAWLNGELRNDNTSGGMSVHRTYPTQPYPQHRLDYDNIHIGGQMDHAGTTWNKGYSGRIYEILMFDSDITAGDYDKIYNYLRDKYRFDGSGMVKDCAVSVYPAGAYSDIEANDSDAMSNGIRVNNKSPHGEQTVEYWMQFDGIGYGATNERIRETNTWFRPVQEGSKANMANTSSQYTLCRHSMRMYPQNSDNSFYFGNNLGSRLRYKMVNRQWYHVKMVRENINEPTWNGRLYVNGILSGEYTQNNVTNITLDGRYSRFGAHPSYEIIPDSERDTAARLRPVDQPTMRIAGYRVVNESLSASATYDLSGNMTATGTTKPTEVASSTTTAPRVPVADRGAAVDLRLQTLGASKPKIFGKYEITSPKWGNHYSYTNKGIYNLDHIPSVPGAEKTFKNTEISLQSNNISDISGLGGLYSVETGPGNDLPTTMKHLNIYYNRLKDFTGLEGTTFEKHCNIYNLNAHVNPLTSLDGLGGFNQVRSIRAYDTYSLTSIDDLHRANWSGYFQGLFYNGKIASINTKALTGVGVGNSSGNNMIELYNNSLSTFNNMESDWMNIYNLKNQRVDVVDMNTGILPVAYKLYLGENYYTSKELLSNTSTIWPQVYKLNMYHSNIANFAPAAYQTGKTQSISNTPPSQVHDYTGSALDTMSGFTELDCKYKNRRGTHQNCVEFAGADQYIETNVTLENVLQESFSVTCWYKTPESFGTHGEIVGTFPGVGHGTLEIRLTNSNAIEVFFSDSVTANAPYNTTGRITGNVFNTRTWYHLAFTFDKPASGGTLFKCYIDGAEAATTTVSNYLADLPLAGGTFPNNLYVGARNRGSATTDLYLKGSLADLAIYDQVITSSDVVVLYNDGVIPADAIGIPVLWYKFGDGPETSTWPAAAVEGTTLRCCGSSGVYAKYKGATHLYKYSLMPGCGDDDVRTTGLVTAYTAGKRFWTQGKLDLSTHRIEDLRIFEHCYHGYDGVHSYNSASNTAHTVLIDYADVPDTANALGVLKNFKRCAYLSLRGNGLVSVNSLFVDTGFVDAGWQRSDFQADNTFRQLQLQYNPITDLSFMLKKNFAGVVHLYLNNTDVDYSDFAAIATQLITLKNNGQINLNHVYLSYSVWDRKHFNGGVTNWAYSSYYFIEQASYKGHDHPLGNGLYSEYTRADGIAGYGSSPSPQQQLRIDMWNAGITLHFTNPSTGSPNTLGTTDPNSNTTYKLNTYPNEYLDTVPMRFGHDLPDGRIKWTETDGTTPNASNTLTLTFSVSLPGFAGGVMKICNIVGTGTPDNASLTIGGTGASLFGNTADWKQSTGELTLTIASGQTIQISTLYTLTFTLINPDDNTDTGANATWGRLTTIQFTDHDNQVRSTNSSGDYIMDITP